MHNGTVEQVLVVVDNHPTGGSEIPETLQDGSGSAGLMLEGSSDNGLLTESPSLPALSEYLLCGRQ